MASFYVAEILQGAAAAAVVVRLLALNLGRRQASLLLFVVFIAATQFSLPWLPLKSPLYFWGFVFYAMGNWVTAFLAVREMFALSMEGYPGIRSAARWALYVSMAVSGFASLFITVASWGHGRSGRSRLFYFQNLDRSILVTLAVIALGLIFFLSRYPLHLIRNTYVSCGFFSAVLLCQAGLDLVDSFRSDLFFIQADIATSLASSLLYCGWALMLRTESAAEPRRVSFEKPDEADLLRQLEAMNQLLIRVGRRG